MEDKAYTVKLPAVVRRVYYSWHRKGPATYEATAGCLTGTGRTVKAAQAALADAVALAISEPGEPIIMSAGSWFAVGWRSLQAGWQCIIQRAPSDGTPPGYPIRYGFDLPGEPGRAACERALRRRLADVAADELPDEGLSLILDPKDRTEHVISRAGTKAYRHWKAMGASTEGAATEQGTPSASARGRPTAAMSKP